MQTEIELFRAITENLYTAVLGDVLDVLGHTHQFLPQPIQPMQESMRVVGRAMPVQIADTWGQQKDPFGLMTEALRAANAFVFDRMRLHRIMLWVADGNAPAIHVYQKLGFVEEGRARDTFRRNGQWHDMVLMGLLEGELRD